MQSVGRTGLEGPSAECACDMHSAGRTVQTRVDYSGKEGETDPARMLVYTVMAACLCVCSRLLPHALDRVLARARKGRGARLSSRRKCSRRVRNATLIEFRQHGCSDICKAQAHDRDTVHAHTMLGENPVSLGVTDAPGRLQRRDNGSTCQGFFNRSAYFTRIFR